MACSFGQTKAALFYPSTHQPSQMAPFVRHIHLAPLETFDFSQHIFGPGFHFKVCVRKIAFFIVANA
jgi:hypothetical protein